MVILKEDTIDFNKELFLAEIGAAFGGPIVSLIVSQIGARESLVAFFAVIGSLIGSSIMWLSSRINHRKVRGDYSNKKLAGDIVYFTPFAFATSFLVYQPMLYSISKKLLLVGGGVVYSVIVAQLTAFFTFLVIINIYRFFLFKSIGKRL
jgi:hypothetical protein